MKRVMGIAVSVLLATVAIGMTSCGGGGGKVTYISIGTGGTGGTYYPYGGALAKIWSEQVPGVSAVAEVTGASVENVKLAHKGKTVIGEIMSDVAYYAYNGEGKFDSRMDILVLAAMYPNVLQVVTKKNSGVETIGQLKGKTVSIGAPGSGTAFMSDLVLEALGVNKEEFEVARLSFNESAMALKDGTVDVGVWSVAAPTSSIMDLATTHDVRIIPLTADEQKRVTGRYPFYSTHELASGLYRGVDAPVATISVWNVIICKSDLSEDLVYQLAKVLFENNKYMQKIHPMARFTTPENTVKHSPIPLHPGAIKYLKEKGLDVPARLVPKSSGTPQ